MKSTLRIAFSAALMLGGSQFAFGADQIRILAPTWLGFAPVHIAGDLGCFTGKDLDVSIKFEDDLTNVMAAMARGDIELQMRSVGEYQGRPRDASTPGIIIGTIDESVGGDGVITDDRIKSVADLKGKVVAAEPNIPSRLLLQMELKQAGLTLDDLQIKDIATADTGAVFVDDSIAAIATYEPFMSQALKASGRPGARMLVSSKDHRGLIIDAIIARNDDFQANPDKYARFLGCIYEAVDFIRAEPEKFAEMASKHFGLSPTEVSEIVTSSLSYTTLSESLAYMGKAGEKGTLHTIFDTVMDLNLANGAADNKLVAADQIDNSAINELPRK
ncbi:taurine ABC transporter substrate-binding protein [Mesorhizobium sp. L-8-10]|uniref:ABC transporter substrate-binding protein n=1 Tax=Mesorhizobium sp. L-8-10 TaxID=2744523 RepID=UPI0019271FC3|nr:ABC transporter substrate-binding protein [Mesorhizobium sp. L-8-10]BCH29669.1 taurine ABC transporter substrate-binding protein [Mesorhizobium sp. L-8-10]